MSKRQAVLEPTTEDNGAAQGREELEQTMQKSRKVMVFVIGRFFCQIHSLFFYLYFPELLTRSGGVNMGHAARIVFFAGVSSTLGAPIIGHVIDTFSLSPTRLSGLSLLMISPSFLVCHFFVHSASVVAPVMLIIGLTNAIQSMTVSMVLVSLKGKDKLGEGMSKVQNFRTVASIIGGYLFSALLDFHFKPIILWSMWGATCLLAGVFTCLIEVV